jgi:hypothetical protein
MKWWILLIILILSVSCGNYCNNYLKPKKLKGKIFSKYIDENDHYLKKIVIDEKGQQSKLVIIEKNNVLWNYIEVGDSIIKQANNMDIIIIKEGNIQNTFNICY